MYFSILNKTTAYTIQKEGQTYNLFHPNGQFLETIEQLPPTKSDFQYPDSVIIEDGFGNRRLNRNPLRFPAKQIQSGIKKPGFISYYVDFSAIERDSAIVMHWKIPDSFRSSNISIPQCEEGLMWTHRLGIHPWQGGPECPPYRKTVRRQSPR